MMGSAFKLALALASMVVLSACESEPAALAPPPLAPPQPDMISMPSWTESGPRADDFLRVYPARAMRLHVESIVKLPCTIRDDWRLDCRPGWEEAPDLGFNEAGIEVSRLFVVKKSNDQNLRPGDKVVLPIEFRLSE